MNFIRDLGASHFLDGVSENAFQNIQKIVLKENPCSERIKKYVMSRP